MLATLLCCFETHKDTAHTRTNAKLSKENELFLRGKKLLHMPRALLLT